MIKELSKEANEKLDYLIKHGNWSIEQTQNNINDINRVHNIDAGKEYNDFNRENEEMSELVKIDLAYSTSMLNGEQSFLKDSMIYCAKNRFGIDLIFKDNPVIDEKVNDYVTDIFYNSNEFSSPDKSHKISAFLNGVIYGNMYEKYWKNNE